MEPDLKLILDGGREILVWHQVMINASPFFRTMLDPMKFEEGAVFRRERLLEVAFPEVDTSAMAILCSIFHMQARKVPTSKLSGDTLAEIALLVDKYDCVESIQPWQRIWHEQAHIQAELKGLEILDVEDLVKWIHICCHLGYRDHFELLTSEVVRRATLEDLTEDFAPAYSVAFPRHSKVRPLPLIREA
jgi:hypothetical protein